MIKNQIYMYILLNRRDFVQYFFLSALSSKPQFYKIHYKRHDLTYPLLQILITIKISFQCQRFCILYNSIKYISTKKFSFSIRIKLLSHLLNQMSNYKKISSTDISLEGLEINNRSALTDKSWLCFLCGAGTTENLESLNPQQREKVNLSKLVKQRKETNMRKSSTFGVDPLPSSTIHNSVQPSHENVTNRKFNFPPQQIRQKKISSISTSCRTIENNVFGNRPSLNYYHKNNQPSNNLQIRYSHNVNTPNQVVYQQIRQSYGEDIKNIKNSQSHFMGQNLNPFVTGTPQNKDFNSFFIKNRQIKSLSAIVDPSPIKKQQQFQNLSSLQNQKMVIMKCESKKIIEIKDQKQDDMKSSSNYPTQEDIPIQINCRQPVMIRQVKPKKNNLYKKDSQSSGSSRAPKFLKMKKAESRNDPFQISLTSNPSNKSNKSNYTQIGNKIKIGIRKVQSINSSEQEQKSQYSDVISHGQRSFLMPQINQVQQMSRISSNSNFRMWQNDQ